MLLCLLGLVLKVSIVLFVVVKPLTRCTGKEEDDNNNNDNNNNNNVPSCVTPQWQYQQPSCGLAMGS
jgi:hypothetical protein